MGTVKHERPELPKPGDSVKYSTSQSMGKKFLGDGFINLLANLGVGAENHLTSTQYINTSDITWNRESLDAMIRQSWVVRRAASVVAEDMCREGIEIKCPDLGPSDIDKLHQEMVRLNIWGSVEDAITWARLYGGAVAILMIDGQDMSTPLRPSTIGKGQFKGLYVLDRWTIWPSVNDLVEDFGPDFGLPKYYTISTGDGAGLDNQTVHHSRILRFIGNKLPYWQAIRDLWWGQSVVETMYDRLVSFDMATFGAAQLVNKAYLRTLKVPDFTQIMAGNADAQQAILNQILFMKLTQSTESIVVIDKEDELEFNSYQFAGLKDVLIQLGEQLAGACGTPTTRLFGQSPNGMSATGESDLKGYYDMVGSKQEKDLRYPLSRLMKILIPSTLGVQEPECFDISFNSLWKLSDIDKADIAAKDIAAIVAASDSGVYTAEVALKEIRQLSGITGRGTSVTDDDIEKASTNPPLMTGGETDVTDSEMSEYSERNSNTILGL